MNTSTAHHPRPSHLEGATLPPHLLLQRLVACGLVPVPHSICCCPRLPRRQHRPPPARCSCSSCHASWCELPCCVAAVHAASRCQVPAPAATSTCCCHATGREVTTTTTSSPDRAAWGPHWAEVSTVSGSCCCCCCCTGCVAPPARPLCICCIGVLLQGQVAGGGWDRGLVPCNQRPRAQGILQQLCKPASTTAARGPEVVSTGMLYHAHCLVCHAAMLHGLHAWCIACWQEQGYCPTCYASARRWPSNAGKGKNCWLSHANKS
jgi:hypothetical protein